MLRFSKHHTAISINVVGLKLQVYATRPNGGLGIHWNLHICEDENYEFLLLCAKPERVRSECACSHEPFSVAFFYARIFLITKIPLKFTVASIICFYVPEEKENKNPAKSLHLISIQHMQQPSTSTHTVIRSRRLGLKL